MDEQKFAEILKTVLNEHTATLSNPATHRLHHQFIETLLIREERRVARWEKIKTQVIGWGIIVVLGAIGTAVYSYIIHTPTT